MSYNLKQQPLPLSSREGRFKGGVVHHYWWGILFISLCFGMYMHAAYKKDQAIQTLTSYLEGLKREKEDLLREKEELLLNINSQNDPSWVELTLMKGLGLVPEGKVKVYFDPVAKK